MDSYEANYVYALQERVLVLNFANAHHPRGGFIAGASAQEESLCRCSSLFASINSENARETYDFNNEEPDPFDSDYMLISPYVEVFRYVDGELRDDSFTTAVLTIPAPNLYGMAEGVDKNQLKIVMKEKIRSFMMVSARYVYDTLVLGAWGCGAFGHDAKDVAQYFKEVIEEEEYYHFFGKIIFAVYDKTPDQYNYQSFLEAFGEHGLWKDEGNKTVIISAHYKLNTKDENGDAIICEEAIMESLEDLKSILDDYLENDHVTQIEIIK